MRRLALIGLVVLVLLTGSPLGSAAGQDAANRLTRAHVPVIKAPGDGTTVAAGSTGPVKIDFTGVTARDWEIVISCLPSANYEWDRSFTSAEGDGLRRWTIDPLRGGSDCSLTLWDRTSSHSTDENTVDFSVARRPPSGDGHQHGMVRLNTSKLVINHAYKYLRYRLHGPQDVTDAYEFCSVDLELQSTGRALDSDQVDASDNFAGAFKVYDWELDRPGKYAVVADCYWSGRGRARVAIKLGTKTELHEAVGAPGKVSIISVVKVWSREREAWAPLRRGVVLVQRKTKAGWTTIARPHLRPTGQTDTPVRMHSGVYRLHTLPTRRSWPSTSGTSAHPVQGPGG